MGLGRKPICVFRHAHKVNCPNGAREGGLGRVIPENRFLIFFAAKQRNSTKFFDSLKKREHRSRFQCVEKVLIMGRLPCVRGAVSRKAD